MKTLLTFVGYQDPFSKGLVEKQPVTGPILNVVDELKIDKVWLFSTPGVDSRTEETITALKQRYPELLIERVDTGLEDPTDYKAIFKAIKKKQQAILAEKDQELYISVSSGTPQMHTSWLMLSLGGLLPARIVQPVPPRFAGDPKKLVREIDFSMLDFAQIRLKSWPKPDNPDPAGNFDRLVEELGIIGNHPSFLKTLDLAQRAAGANCPVVIAGESGTGKDLVARLIHGLSNRAGKSFIPINCSGLPAQLVESELFGHVRGAFTGAVSEKGGLFQAADKGTLFLDEVGELPLEVQVKLLRVLQNGELRKVGGKNIEKVDVRLLAATNRDLAKDIRAGRFREDLFHRISVISIKMAPLRERHSDIPALALRFLDKFNSQSQNQKEISPAAMEKLMHHGWPGNIRELENIIQSAFVMCSGPSIRPENIFFNLMENLPDGSDIDPYVGFNLEKHLKNTRDKIISKALEKSGNRQTTAAKMLGISPQAVNKYLKMKK